MDAFPETTMLFLAASTCAEPALSSEDLPETKVAYSERTDGLGYLVTAALTRRPDHELTQFFAGLMAGLHRADLQTSLESITKLPIAIPPTLNFGDSTEAIIEELRKHVRIHTVSETPKLVFRGQVITVQLTISSDLPTPRQVWLGASLVDICGRESYNTEQDTTVVLQPGTHLYSRELTVSKTVAMGEAKLVGAVWIGKCGDPASSQQIVHKWVDGILQVR